MHARTHTQDKGAYISECGPVRSFVHLYHGANLRSAVRPFLVHPYPGANPESAGWRPWSFGCSATSWSGTLLQRRSLASQAIAVLSSRSTATARCQGAQSHEERAGCQKYSCCVHIVRGADGPLGGRAGVPWRRNGMAELNYNVRALPCTIARTRCCRLAAVARMTGVEKKADQGHQSRFAVEGWRGMKRRGPFAQEGSTATSERCSMRACRARRRDERDDPEGTDTSWKYYQCYVCREEDVRRVNVIIRTSTPAGVAAQLQLWVELRVLVVLCMRRTSCRS